MKLDANSEILIRRYLLAALSEDDRERVETRLMTDDGFFQQIGLVEDELIDQYLDGELSSADCRRFEETFLCAAERQQKLRFARALRAYAAEHAPAAATTPVPWWHSLVRMVNPPRPVLAYSVLAASLVLAVGASLAFYQIAGLKGRISELQAQQQKARSDEVAAQLQLEQEKRSKEEGKETTQMAMLNPPSFLLSPGVQRSAQSFRPIEIADNQTLIRVKLDLPENPHPAYRAVLLSDGQEILSLARLKAVETPDQITISLDLPTAGLTAGVYEIRLYGSGDSEPMESYVFQITRK